jgi:hypothetical protein
MRLHEAIQEVSNSKGKISAKTKGNGGNYHIICLAHSPTPKLHFIYTSEQNPAGYSIPTIPINREWDLYPTDE